MLTRWRFLFSALVMCLASNAILSGAASKRTNSSFLKVRPQLSSRSDLIKVLRRRALRRPQPNADAPGYNYVTFVPYVTREAGTRTNLGLNNVTPSSIAQGSSPSAHADVMLVDQQGYLSGEGSYTVRSNELLQVNDVITDLGGDVDRGWLFIFSDEPLDVWASVIENSSNDPSIETGSSFGGTRLMIQSSVKTGRFQSSLVLINVGSGGNANVKIYGHEGQLLETRKVVVEEFGMYYNPDIRDSTSGTYGPIIIEAKDQGVYLLASSIVKSLEGTGGFFPAAAPDPNLSSIAGVWEGTLKGTLINAQVSLTLFQEGGSVGGHMEVVSGDFPTSTSD